MWQVFEIIINFYQATIMTFYVNRRCNLRKHNLLYDIAILLCIGTAITCLDYVHIYILDDLIFILPLAFSIFFRKGGIFDNFFWCILLGVIFSIDSTFTSSILSSITGAGWEDLLKQNDARMLYVVGANLLHTILIMSVCNIRRKDVTVSYGVTACFLLSLLSQFISAECFYLIRTKTTGDLSSATYGSVGLFLSMILTIVLYEIMIRETDARRKLELETQTSQLIGDHQEELRIIYSNMLSTQHDLRHRISVAEELLLHNETKMTHQAIDLLKDTEILNEFVTGNMGVDAVLVAKTATMKEAGITFSFYPCPLIKLPIPERDFVVLLSNILDNAIEAVMRLDTSSSSREVKLVLSRTWDIFSVICENDLNPSMIHQQDGEFISSKAHPELHGYGIRSVQRTVEDAGGLAEFSIEKKKFVVRIMLPMEE